MNKAEITLFLKKTSKSASRNLIIIDFANVDRWQESLGWPVGIKQLADLLKHISVGKKYLRRFYYGEDYGPKDRSNVLTKWSENITRSAKFNNFELISKRVKYIPDNKYETGFIKKCNLDIEMAVDMLKEVDNYDNVYIFSGDGDLAYAIKYLVETHNKVVYILVLETTSAKN